MTESLSLFTPSGVSLSAGICALWRTWIVAAADCRHCLSTPQHFLFHNKRKAHTPRGAGGVLCSSLEWASLSFAETDGPSLFTATSRSYHSLLCSLAASLARFPPNSATHHESFMRAAFSAACGSNNENFPAWRAVKMFTAARSFAVHWRTAFIYPSLRCARLYGVFKLLSLCEFVVGFALWFLHM